MAKWPQTCPMNFLHIDVNGYCSKEVTQIGKGFNKKKIKILEGAMIKAHIYEMYFEHGFKRKDIILFKYMFTDI